MGPYCKFCDQRCFVLRTLRDGRSMLLATCARGMERDREKIGEDHTTAINPAAPGDQAATELVYEITVTARDRETNADGVTSSRLLGALALAEELPPAEAAARLRAIADRIDIEAGTERPPLLDAVGRARRILEVLADIEPDALSPEHRREAAEVSRLLAGPIVDNPAEARRPASPDVLLPGPVPGTYGLIEADSIRALVGYVDQRDGTTQPANVLHIRSIGSSAVNLCGETGGQATYPAAATCGMCRAEYAEDEAFAEDSRRTHP